MSLFRTILGPQWDALPKEVQASHLDGADITLEGKCQIENGASLLAQGLARIFGFPPAGQDVPVVVVKTARDKGEVWTRHFGQHQMTSRLSHGPNGLQEKFGPVVFDIGLHVAEGALHFPVVAARLGPIPLPELFLPRSETREHVVDGKFCFDVTVYTPLTRVLMVRYKGWLIHPSRS